MADAVDLDLDLDIINKECHTALKRFVHWLAKVEMISFDAFAMRCGFGRMTLYRTCWGETRSVPALERIAITASGIMGVKVTTSEVFALAMEEDSRKGRAMIRKLIKRAKEKHDG